MEPMKAKKRAFYFYAFIVCFFAVVPLLVLYSLGYSLSTGYSLIERGGLYVFTPESGSYIYVNNELKKETGLFQKELFLQNLKPREYTVIVANDLYWPWTKDIVVREKEVSPVFPLLVPRDLELREIKVSTSTPVVRGEYEKINALFAPTSTSTTPQSATVGVASTSPEARAIEKKHMKVWSDGASVFASWIGNESRIPPYFCGDGGGACVPTIRVITQPSTIRHVDFYPGRDDAIILSSDEGVFAVELDIRTYQNAYPLYQGKNPDFRVEDDEVFVKDGSFIGQFMAL